MLDIIAMSVIAGAFAKPYETEALIKPDSVPIIFPHFQHKALNAGVAQVLACFLQQGSANPPAPVLRSDRESQNLGFVRRYLKQNQARRPVLYFRNKSCRTRCQ